MTLKTAALAISFVAITAGVVAYVGIAALSNALGDLDDPRGPYDRHLDDNVWLS